MVTTEVVARRPVSVAGRRRRSAIVMAVPALVLFGLFGLVPLVGVLVLSFAKWDGLGGIGWTGIDNWTGVLTDHSTWSSIWLTIQVVVLSWLIQTPIALILGMFQAPPARWRAVV